jgi:hypothetical protein
MELKNKMEYKYYGKYPSQFFSTSAEDSRRGFFVHKENRRILNKKIMLSHNTAENVKKKGLETRPLRIVVPTQTITTKPLTLLPKECSHIPTSSLKEPRPLPKEPSYVNNLYKGMLSPKTMLTLLLTGVSYVNNLYKGMLSPKTMLTLLPKELSYIYKGMLSPKTMLTLLPKELSYIYKGMLSPKTMLTFLPRGV